MDTPNLQSQSQLNSPPPGAVPLVLAGPLDQYAAETLKTDALKLLNAGGEAILDFRNIDRLHTACLQVLIALQNDLGKKDQRLSLQSVDTGLRRLFRISGTEDLFHFVDGSN